MCTLITRIRFWFFLRASADTKADQDVPTDLQFDGRPSNPTCCRRALLQLAVVDTAGVPTRG